MAFANPDEFEVVPKKPAIADPNDFEVVASPSSGAGPESTSPESTQDFGLKEKPYPDNIPVGPSERTPDSIAEEEAKPDFGDSALQKTAAILRVAARTIGAGIGHGVKGILENDPASVYARMDEKDRKAAEDHLDSQIAPVQEAVSKDQMAKNPATGNYYGDELRELQRHKLLIQRGREIKGDPTADPSLYEDALKPEQLQRDYETNPDLENTPAAAVARIAGGIGGFVAEGAVNPALPLAQMVASASSEAGDAAVAKAKENGETDETKLAELRNHAAKKAAGFAAATIPIYLAGGAAATAAGKVLGPTASALTKATLETGVSAASNVAIGAGMRRLENGNWELPTGEQVSQDLGWALLHGYGAYKSAVKERAAEQEKFNTSIQALSPQDFESLKAKLKPIPDTDPRKIALESEIIRRDATRTATPLSQAAPVEAPPSETPQAPVVQPVSQPNTGTAGSFRQAQKEEAHRAKIEKSRAAIENLERATDNAEATGLTPDTVAANRNLITELRADLAKMEVAGPESTAPKADVETPAEEAVAPKESAPVETIAKQEQPGVSEQPEPPVAPFLRAAFKMNDGEVIIAKPGVINHAMMGLSDEQLHRVSDTGFVDKDGKFLTRKEAHDLSVKKSPAYKDAVGKGDYAIGHLIGEALPVINKELTPAIKTEEGIKTGQNHPEIIEREGLEPEVRDAKDAGFVTDEGEFKTREQAAEETGLPTNKEEGKLHSSDLPKEDPELLARAKARAAELKALYAEDEPVKRAADMSKEELKARMENDLAEARKAGNTRAAKDIRARIKALDEQPKSVEPDQAVEKPKESWEKTRDEIKAEDGSLAKHRLDVRAALKAGKPVPLEVLEGYAGSAWADDAIEKQYGGKASDSLLGKVKKALEDDPTKMYADPLLIQTVGKPLLRGAVKVFEESLEAGKLVKDAIEDAMSYLRTNVPNFDEERARTLFGNLEDQPKGGDSNERTEEKGQKEGVLTPPGEGEEVPSQSPEPEDPIGIQNAVTDALRDKHGIGERDAIIKRTFPTVKAEADAAFTANQFVGKELVDELKKKTRPLDDREDAILTIELARRKNEYESALSDGTAKEQNDALARYLDIIPVSENVGTANARGLNARKMMINSDYTLAGIARRVYREKGSPLTPEEMQDLAKDAKKIKDKEKETAAKREKEEAKSKDSEITAAYEATIADLKKQLAEKGKYSKPKTETQKKSISEAFNNAVDEAQKRLAKVNWKALLGGETGGVGGVGGGKGGKKLGEQEKSESFKQVISDLAIVGAGHIIKGAATFGKWSAKMSEQFGDSIKPHLRLIYDAAKAQQKKIEEAAGKPKEKTPAQANAAVKADATAGEELSHKSVYDLARAHINAGVHGEDAVMKAVHNDVKEGYPDATERDVRRAFSEYGKVKFPSPDAVKKELREIRTLTRLQESIDREKAGLDALHSGLQRDKATQSVREKQKQLNELLKARQGPQSPEKLASRDQAKQTALRNAIADLDKQLKTGEKPTKSSPLPDSPETEQLRAERDAMKEKLKEIEAEANPPKSPAEKQLEELGKRKQRMDDILSGKLDPKKPASQAMLSTAAEDIQAEIHAMQELAAQMRRDALPEKDPGSHSEQQQIKALEKSIERYRQKTAEKDFTTLGKKLGPDTVTVAQMKEIRDSRKSMYEEQRKLANPPKTPDEIYNERRMSQIAKRRAELEAQDKELTATRQITPKSKPAKKFLFPETAKADAELTQLKKDIDNKIGRIKYEDRSPAHRAVDGLVSAWRALTAITITGHGTTGMGTHAGGVAFRPTEAKKYWTNFARQFGMWANKPFHDEAIFRLKNNPLYETAKSAGLAVDPDKTYTDYSMYAHWLENPPKILGKPGKLAAAFIKSGERGFDALKLMRMEMFEGEYNRLSPELKADPETAKLLADMTNKATGAIPKTSPIAPRGANALDTAQNQIYNMAKNGISNAVLFAPRLLASRWMRATFDPVKTVYTFANWSSETPAQRQIAIRKAQHAAEFAATYAAALLINQGLLAASGSKQNVNFTNPSDTDWLKFKAFDKVITADGGLLDPIRLIGQIVLGDILHEMTPAEKFKNETKFKKVFAHLGQYARGKFNPTFGLFVDATTGTDFTGRPLPVDLPSVIAKRPQPTQTKKDAEFHPKYTWKEWIAQRGPIPLSGGTKIIYDRLRKSGRTHVEAKDIIEGAAATAFEMTGEKIGEDNPRRLKSMR